PKSSVPASAGRSRPNSSSGGSGGIRLPSVQVYRAGGITPRAGKYDVTTQARGQASLVMPVDIASTAVGAPRSSAQDAPSMMWPATSPNAPVPKSHQPRHFRPGMYAGS